MEQATDYVLSSESIWTKTIKQIFEEKCECSFCKCEKCGESRLTKIRNTQKLNPNHYRLFNYWICKKCDNWFLEELGEQKWEAKPITEIVKIKRRG